MKIEIKFAGDVDAEEVNEFMQNLYILCSHYAHMFTEIRIVREPKQTE